MKISALREYEAVVTEGGALEMAKIWMQTKRERMKERERES